MRISVTEASIFQRCQRMWYYNVVEALEPKAPQPNLWFGSGIHAALETYYKDPNRDLKNMRATWDKYVLENPLPEGEIYDEVRVLGPNILTVYWHYDQNQPAWEPAWVEKRMSVPIPGTDGELSGRMDLVLKDAEGLWVVDHKTSKQLFAEMPGLEVDEQVTAYCWMIWKTLGVIPAGVIYNVIGKSAKNWPVILDSGAISKAKNQNTTYDLLLATIKRNKLDPGDYAEVLKHYQQKPPVIRHYSSRTLTELENYERHLVLKYERMKAVAEDFRLGYISPSAQSCGFCNKLPLCTAENKGEHELVRWIKTCYTTRVRDLTPDVWGDPD